MTGIQRKCLFVYFAAVILTVLGSPISLTRFEYDAEFDDYIQTDPGHIFKQTNSTFQSACAYLCNNDDACAAFYFTSTIQKCQLQNTRSMKGAGHMTFLNGTRYFYRGNIGMAGMASKTTTGMAGIITQQPSFTISTDARVVQGIGTSNTIGIEQSSSPISTSKAIVKETTTSAVTAPNFECPVNNGKWIVVNYPDGLAFQYKVFTDEDMTQGQAWSKCHNESADLLKFMTKSSLDTFKQKVLIPCPGLADKQYWVDGDNTLTNNATYKTNNNTPIPLDTGLWGNNKPASPSIHHCIKLQISSRSGSYRFDDTDCYRRNVKTFCQKDCVNSCQ